MSLSLGKAFALFTTKPQVETLITEALATRGITIDATNYTDLTTNYPAASNNGAFAWVESAQGTAWLPGTIGGTYYPLGLYHSNGTDWIFTPSPSQATQAEVNAGTNDDKFVTPTTLANTSQWQAKGAITIIAGSFTDLNFRFPVGAYSGAYAWVNNSEGTPYIPNSDGGTYYPSGLYRCNGSDWVFSPSPYQATQSEVDTGTNTNKFVTPQTLNAATQITSKESLSNKVTTFTDNTSSDTKYPSVKATADYIANSISTGTITSTNGGNGGTSAFTLTGANGYGGAGYYGAMTIQNTGATNGNKYLRVNSTGSLEIVNSAYSSVIFHFLDSGEFIANNNISGKNITVSEANPSIVPSYGYKAYFNGSNRWLSYIDNQGNRIYGDYSDTTVDTWINSGRDIYIIPNGEDANSQGPASRFSYDGKFYLNCVGALPSANTGGQMIMLTDGDMATWKSTGSGNNGLNLWQEGTATNVMIGFQKGAFQSQIGSITCSTTATTYNTSSDYRLKDITGPVTNSGAYIDSLKPVEGTWKIDGSPFVGLIAHEAQEVSRTPVATGEKDGEQMQAMDYSSPEIIANLIAEVQSLRKRLADAGL